MYKSCACVVAGIENNAFVHQKWMKGNKERLKYHMTCSLLRDGNQIGI